MNVTAPTRTVTRALMGDPAPGRTPWAAPGISREPTPVTKSDPPISAGASPEPDAQLALPASAPASEDEGLGPDPAPAETLRPIEALSFDELQLREAPTPPPMVEWMAPADLLVEEAYQRNLGDKSRNMIRRMAEGWD